MPTYPEQPKITRMADNLSIMKEFVGAFNRLIKDNSSEQQGAAMRKLPDLSSTKPEELAAIVDVLNAEYTSSFFDVDHFKNTFAQKHLFSFELATVVCRILEAAYPKQRFESNSGILGQYDSGFVEAAAAKMDSEGYFVMPGFLSEEACDNIVNALDNTLFLVKETGEILDGFNERNVYRPMGNTSWIADQQEILKIPDVQQLIMDPTMLSIIQEYLGCIPIHVQANCWWTINRQKNFRSRSSDAQLFHQDMEFIRFVKVFVYLNNVGGRNGPHSYIAGSARDSIENVPNGYSISQRISDCYLARRYASKRFVQLKGSRGTVLLEDTRGFHKGEPVEEGYRLMLQLEFCCSLYFNPTPSFSFRGLTQPFRDFADRHPRLFLNYDNDRYEASRRDLSIKLSQRVKQPKLTDRVINWFSRAWAG